MRNEMENYATDLFLVELCCFHVQCLEEEEQIHPFWGIEAILTRSQFSGFNHGHRVSSRVNGGPGGQPDLCGCRWHLSCLHLDGLRDDLCSHQDCGVTLHALPPTWTLHVHQWVGSILGRYYCVPGNIFIAVETDCLKMCFVWRKRSRPQ